MKTAHRCSWTRRRLSELRRERDRISGAGIVPEALERIATLLGTTLTRRPNGEDEYGEVLEFGSLARVETHDDCFCLLEPVTPALELACIRALLDLHSGYLDLPVDWTQVLPVVHAKLLEGTTLRMRSDPRRKAWSLRSYPSDSGLLARLRAPALRVDCSGGIGLIE